MTAESTVSVKLGGAMVKYAPAQSDNSKQVYQIAIPGDGSVQAILDVLGVPENQPLMVILNEAMIARPDYSSTVLGNGDALSLMPPITAG